MASADLSSTHAAAPHKHDVAIVGGGLVGASLAIALAQAGIDAALIEATGEAALPPVFDQRNLSLAEATVNALTALGVLQKLQLPPAPIKRIHISREGDFGRVQLQAGDYAREQFGQVVVASDFGQALEARLREWPQLARYRAARFVGLGDADVGYRGVRLATAQGEQVLQARLLVAADGADSAVRDALGIGIDVHDYAQTAFIARVRAERTADGSAWERLTAHGPVALLPRGDRHYGAVLCVAANQAGAVAALDDEAWLMRLQAAFGWRAGRFLACGPRSAYPLRKTVAQRVIAPRAVLVGNAAQAVHPLGAQGFNLGLRDALTLAEMLQAEGVDVIDGDLLPRYAQRRAEDRGRTIAFSDGFARLGSTPGALASVLRAAGLAGIARIPALQAMLVGGAMGYRGDVPALCRNAQA